MHVCCRSLYRWRVTIVVVNALFQIWQWSLRSLCLISTNTSHCYSSPRHQDITLSAVNHQNTTTRVQYRSWKSRNVKFKFSRHGRSWYQVSGIRKIWTLHSATSRDSWKINQMDVWPMYMFPSGLYIPYHRLLSDFVRSVVSFKMLIFHTEGNWFS